ncbi:tetratricopeptide repeat protein [Actinopolymorpha alba]|uniref:tetratricopeptide repeat protein n=1 Tax=Actinopolymorpha alba TaxID=533267 RepID=UPI0003A15FD8|nr:tetratricopeptide repeat protein [Actinopolymorpha alba]
MPGPPPLAQQRTPPPAAPPAARVLIEPRSGIVRNAFVGGAALAGIFLSGLASDLLAGVLSGSEYLGPINQLLNVLGIAIFALLLVIWGVGRYLAHRRGDARDLDADLVAPGPPVRPSWFRARPALHGRDDAVRRAVDLVLSNGAVAVTGPPGSGSSAVVAAVVHNLIAQGHAEQARTAPFDLRGWSTLSPDDGPTIAAMLLAVYQSAEPSGEDPPALAAAARRLLQKLSEPPAVLVLDNVARPEQVAWLIQEWTKAGNHPLLVVAGGPGVGAAFPGGSVELDDLAPAELHRIWRDQLNAHTDRSQAAADDASTSVEWTSSTNQWLGDVLTVCGGRPGAVHDLAREVTRPGSHWTPLELRDFLARTSPGVDPMERVWEAILWRTRDSMSRKARLLARALADLPVAELTVEAMEAVRHGLDDLAESLDQPDGTAPEEPARPPDVDVIDPLQELGLRSVVRTSSVGRYRMPAEVRRAVARTEFPEDRRTAVRAALPSLVQRYADLADRWVMLLDDATHAVSARRWFQTEEPPLRALATVDYTAQATDDRKGPLLPLMLDDLARLADALDRWYVRQHQTFGADLVHAMMVAFAEDTDRPDLRRLAATRLAAVRRAAGDHDGAQHTLHKVAGLRRRPDRTSWALRARHHHEQALLRLARAEHADNPTAAGTELAEAERALQRTWVRLPRKDIAGEVTTLLSMAVVYLRQGQPDRALDRLDLAETRAQESNDTAGEAHVTELRGIAAWMQGRAPVAVAMWQRAWTRFAELADQHGEARCLQHLGSAVLVAPDLAGLLLADQRRPLDQVTAVQHAQAWLERAERLRPGHGASSLTERYLREARARGFRAKQTPEPLEEDLPARRDSDTRSRRPERLLTRLITALGQRLR